MLSSSSASVSASDAEEAEVVEKDAVKEEDNDEPEHLTSSSWRAGPTALRPKGVKEEEEGEPWIPVRVTKALEQSKDFAEFKEKRQFIYVHLFAGKQDVLGEAIGRLAKLDGLNVEVRSLDRDSDDNQVDLAATSMDAARGGLIDGSHSGFPCGSFSRARYNPGHGPPPVRSLEYIYGLPSNDVRQQAEADKGS